MATFRKTRFNLYIIIQALTNLMFLFQDVGEDVSHLDVLGLVRCVLGSLDTVVNLAQPSSGLLTVSDLPDLRRFHSFVQDCFESTTCSSIF